MGAATTGPAPDHPNTGLDTVRYPRIGGVDLLHVAIFRLLSGPLAVCASRSLAVDHNASAVVARAAEPAPA